MAWNDPLKKTGDGADDRILSLCISTFGWIKHHLKWCLHQCNTCQRCNFRLDLGENYIFINTIHDIFATPPILIDVSIQELQCFFGGAWRIRPTCPLACCCWSLGAMVGSWFFERRIWCRHLCPIGGMNGLYAKLAVTELRAQNGHLVVSPGWSHQNQLICINVSTTLKKRDVTVHDIRRVTLYIWTTIRIYPDW